MIVHIHAMLTLSWEERCGTVHLFFPPRHRCSGGGYSTLTYSTFKLNTPIITRFLNFIVSSSFCFRHQCHQNTLLTFSHPNTNSLEARNRPGYCFIVFLLCTLVPRDWLQIMLVLYPLSSFYMQTSLQVQIRFRYCCLLYDHIRPSVKPNSSLSISKLMLTKPI